MADFMAKAKRLGGKIKCNRKVNGLDVKCESLTEEQIGRLTKLTTQLETEGNYSDLVRIYRSLVIYYNERGLKDYGSFLKKMEIAMSKRGKSEAKEEQGKDIEMKIVNE